MLSAMWGMSQVPTDAAGWAWVVGSLYGLLSTPDLDQIEKVGNKVGGYYGQSVIRDTFGGGKVGAFIEYAWWTYWQPYAKAIGHRDWKSHIPVISTLGRMIYGLPFIIIFYIFLHDNFSYFVIALITSDTIHWAFDLKVWRGFGWFKQ